MVLKRTSRIIYPSFVVLFGGDGFPTATIIYNQNRPKSQHKTKNPVKIRSKSEILVVK
jgi:hypothetical protein